MIGLHLRPSENDKLCKNTKKTTKGVPFAHLPIPGQLVHQNDCPEMLFQRKLVHQFNSVAKIIHICFFLGTL